MTVCLLLGVLLGALGALCCYRLGLSEGSRLAREGKLEKAPSPEDPGEVSGPPDGGPPAVGRASENPGSFPLYPPAARAIRASARAARAGSGFFRRVRLLVIIISQPFRQCAGSGAFSSAWVNSASHLGWERLKDRGCPPVSKKQWRLSPVVRSSPVRASRIS